MLFKKGHSGHSHSQQFKERHAQIVKAPKAVFRAEKMAEGILRERLFALFEEEEHWTKRALADRLGQSEVRLRNVVCIC